MVEKTRDRERLASRDGERCLLHTAARYGQVKTLKTLDNMALWVVMRVRYRV